MRAKKLAKGCGIGCGGLLALLIVAALVLMWWKPWAPEITVADPAQGGQRVTDGGLLGNYYPAQGSTGDKGPAVLVLGGSEGGLNPLVDREARELAGKGISALALSYWGGPGQSERMEKLPLETFDTALTWLGKQPGVDPNRLGVMGTSKGGEAAVLLGSRHPELKAVVGIVPSNVVWQGFDQAEMWRMITGMDSTWSEKGTPVPYLPYTDQYRGGDLVELYRLSLTALPQHPEAAIPVEQGKAPMLLVCGEVDTMWPSCPMSRDIEKRAKEKDGPKVTVLAYPEAGHAAGGPPLPEGMQLPPGLASLGGTPEGNAEASADGWPKIVAFLQENLAAR